MMRFPTGELLNEFDCYEYFLQLLYPIGLACPHGGSVAKIFVTTRCGR
jgi:hypothetical protein